jgi:hypothetical protein
MVEHVRRIGMVSLARAILELVLGAYLLLVATRWGGEGWPVWWPTYHHGAKPLSGDRAAFYAGGALLVVFALLRSIQAVLSLRVRDWGRRVGLWLAIFDFATPVTLPLAFWSLVVYRHPDTRDYFRRRREERARKGRA